MKKLLTFLVFLLVITCSVSVFADYQTVDIYVNGDVLVSDSPAVLVGSRTMVPLRAISEKLGCDVGWDDATQTAEIRNSKTAVYVTIDSDVMVKKTIADGVSVDIKIDAPAMLYNSRTLIPLRAVSEALDATVEWDSERECALITTAGIQTYYGVMTEKEYVSDELGLKFTAPDGVSMKHEPEKVKVSEWTDDVETIDAETVFEFSAMYDETGSNITYAVSPKTSVEAITYLEYVRESLENQPDGEITFVAAEGLEKIEAAGYTFDCLTLEAEYGGGYFNVKYCVARVNDRLVVLNVVYIDEADADMHALINSIVSTK